MASGAQDGAEDFRDRAPLGPAERANLLTIVMDGDLVARLRSSLTVIGIEDVIAEQAASWRAHRVPSAQATTRIQVLVALAHRRIGGPFRAGYLQRRLAHDTGGEVAFEATWSGEGTEHHVRRARWRSAVCERWPTPGASRAALGSSGRRCMRCVDQA